MGLSFFLTKIDITITMKMTTSKRRINMNKIQKKIVFGSPM